MVLEIASPVWAERTDDRKSNSPWHPEHIAERYGLFTIIVLGECILSSFGAINDAVTNGGVSARLIVIAVAVLITMFGLWWSYFRIDAGSMLAERPHLAFVWGYVHYALFAAIAAFGAGIAVVAEWSAAHQASPGAAAEGENAAVQTVHFALSDTATSLVIGIPVTVALVVTAAFHGMSRQSSAASRGAAYGPSVLVVIGALLGGVIGVPASLLVIAATVAGKVTFGILTNPTTR